MPRQIQIPPPRRPSRRILPVYGNKIAALGIVAFAVGYWLYVLWRVVFK